MGKKNDLTLEKRNQTNIFYSSFYSLNFIAKTIGVNKSTVSRTMFRDDYSSAAKKGRPRNTTL